MPGLDLKNICDENDFVLFYKDKDATFENLNTQIKLFDNVAYVDLGISKKLEEFVSKTFDINSFPLLIFRNIKITSKNTVESVLYNYYSKFCNEFISKSKYAFFIKGTMEKPYCKYSKQLVKLCNEKNITDVVAFDIFQDNIMREYLKKINNWPTYPMIFIDGQLVGGLDAFTNITEYNKI